jgi:anti-sigma B factor antagonist
MHSAEARPAKAEGSFSISSRRLDGGILLAVDGDVDLATASIVEDELRRAEHSQELVVIDLRGVSFMDSTGIRMLISADRRMREQGGSLQIIHVPAHVYRLFELVGITDHLSIGEAMPGEDSSAPGE